MAQVTDVRIRKRYEEGKVKAIVSATLDDAFVVHGIKILEGESGYFVAMPSKKLKEGDFKDVFHPINQEAREAFQSEVIEKYESQKNDFSEEARELV